MQLKGLFKQFPNELEKGGRSPQYKLDTPVELSAVCPSCKKNVSASKLLDNENVCDCGYHFRINARQRIALLTDDGSFCEMYSEVKSDNPIDFPGYAAKKEKAELSSGENEGVICGTAKTDGIEYVIFAMEAAFMMGSMGTAVGEKITRLFEYATEHRLPVVGCTVSGGARMQEGILSLMQMAKVSGAVKRHSDAGLFYLVILTDPTTGGVTASFAMEGDITVAEPGALIGFAGPRVIEQTTRKRLPPGFQQAEFLQSHGFIDIISPRSELKALTSRLLSFHCGGKCI